MTKDPRPIKHGSQPNKETRKASFFSSSWSWFVWGTAAVALAVWYLSPQLSGSGYTVCSAPGSLNIYTVNESQPKVECITVNRGIITAVGKWSDVQPQPILRLFGETISHIPFFYSGKHAKPKVLPKESILVPGLSDAHAHIIQAGFKMDLPLESARSVQDILRLVRNYILANPDIHNDKNRWIQGMGWDQTKWPGKVFPTAEDLDSDPVLRGRPIVLLRVDVHASWVSPRVLELMGKLPSKVDGGKILRDKKGGPTGILVDNAMALVPIPEWSEAQKRIYFDRATQAALSYGLTSIHDADAPVADIKLFKKYADTNTLPLRIYAMAHNESTGYWGSELPKIHLPRLTVRSVKLFADGALGSWGAALLEPYSDNPDVKGIMKLKEEELRMLITNFWKEGWQVNTHCIGDRANKVVLDVYEEIIRDKGADVGQWRPRIEHAQIFAKADLERMARLGVIASVQPTHATSDMWYAETRLGPERIKGAYAYQTLLKASPNNVLPLGSDFPVEGINPLLGFYAAVARLSEEGTSPHGPGGWYSNEALTRTQALKGMTLDPAYASFTEHELGSLEVGKKADFVVLDRDIMSVPANEILKTKVQATVIDGEVVYGSY